jgi:hypothetical protein
MAICSAKRCLLYGALIASIFASSARAETVAKTVTQWGLPGVWMEDCGRPLGATNRRSTVTVSADGTASGRGENGSYDVHTQFTVARIQPNGHLTLIDTERYSHTLSRRPNGRMQVVAVSLEGEGSGIVRGGIVIQTGEATPSYEKCQ